MGVWRETTLFVNFVRDLYYYYIIIKMEGRHFFVHLVYVTRER